MFRGDSAPPYLFNNGVPRRLSCQIHSKVSRLQSPCSNHYIIRYLLIEPFRNSTPPSIQACELSLVPQMLQEHMLRRQVLFPCSSFITFTYKTFTLIWFLPYVTDDAVSGLIGERLDTVMASFRLEEEYVVRGRFRQTIREVLSVFVAGYNGHGRNAVDALKRLASYLLFL